MLAAGQIRGTAVEEAPGATRALALVESALAQAQLGREEIECIAVGIGPGSYTGIRAAIALAQGWQLGRDVRLLGVSSVECLAAMAHAKGWLGPTSVVIDAQREELYLAKYQVNAAGWSEVDPLRLVAVEAVRQQAGAGELMIGPEVTRWFSTGRTLFPDAGTIAQLAIARSDFVSGEKLEPIYLRETTFVKAPLPRIVS